ncbi:MAG TPA: AAA family ATPase [Candidatus Saccharimonadales bacterium]|jgi:2-phosphoglycerate kinase|nr:AAA family ATPase [Candidatus Saccharimonadales bacterium]
MSKVFIFGAPGSGKTSTSRYLKLLLNYPLVEGDYIRECIARLTKTREQDAYLYMSTKETWRNFGPLNEENMRKGLEASRQSMKPFLDNEIAIHDGNLILEGCFLDPEYSKLGPFFLVVTRDEVRHREQFFKHRPQDQNNEELFRASRVLQEVLMQTAQQYCMPIIANEGPGATAKVIAEQLQ